MNTNEVHAADTVNRIRGALGRTGITGRLPIGVSTWFPILRYSDLGLPEAPVTGRNIDNGGFVDERLRYSRNA